MVLSTAWARIGGTQRAVRTRSRPSPTPTRIANGMRVKAAASPARSRWMRPNSSALASTAPIAPSRRAKRRAARRRGTGSPRRRRGRRRWRPRRDAASRASRGLQRLVELAEGLEKGLARRPPAATAPRGGRGWPPTARAPAQKATTTVRRSTGAQARGSPRAGGAGAAGRSSAGAMSISSDGHQQRAQADRVPARAAALPRASTGSPMASRPGPRRPEARSGGKRRARRNGPGRAHWTGIMPRPASLSG